ncbi:MAG: class II fructose-bisphosphate aldolase [Bacteroidales bacterium]|nr:class II fructose-bisphosphate aldolase [Bacteroidales bacterium]
MLLKELLSDYKQTRQALLAANFYNFETLKGITRAAALLERPVILQLSESSIDYMGLDMAVSMARSIIREYDINAWLHLDHGSSLELLQRCLDKGFDSVMIDASEKSFEENVKISSKAVRFAESYNANVEAELGYVAKLGQKQESGEYTKPDDAKRFVELTGVNALAVAIGTAHGFYKRKPVIRLDILNMISKETPAALVLHGGSGLSDEILKGAVINGINKINLATETKNTFMKKLKFLLTHTEEIDLRKVFPPAIDEVTDLIKKKMIIIKPIDV